MARGTWKARRDSRRGIALVIVLAALVLVSILMLAFLTGVNSEIRSSSSYASSASAKLLAQSAVALVIGEIKAATADQTLCWASQPGMIRTYKNDGTPNGYYKLYSDDNMSGTGAFDHTVAGLVPDGSNGTTPWYNQKGVYVDLNQPIYFNSSYYYPILDGNSADYVTTYTNVLSTKTIPAASSTISTLAPIGPNGLPAVNGFWLNSNTPADSTSPDVAPMPVKWLYILKNGEIIQPDSNPSNNVVTFNKAALKPSAADPITGRIAFWTDDETSKVNINTAGEGTFWDTPRVVSAQDYAFATSQPVQNEFQRYPGHPATVSLSAVFNNLAADSGFPEDLYPLTPRIIAGGSEEGTIPVLSLTGSSALTLRSTRLYATPDEFLFQPNLASGAPGSGLRALNQASLASSLELNPAAIENSQFFITTSSEAPDVNLFNLPRVSMWPITLNSSGNQATTAYDKLIAFCSTINGNIFYFQRQDPTSATTDLPAAASPTGLGRNRSLLEYLRTLTSEAIPGFGGSFAAKYGTPGDCDQILTEMFDYIRSTNLQDQSTGATEYAPALDTGTGNGDPYVQGGAGQVVPIIDQNISITDPVKGTASTASPDNPRGFGRFPTVQEAALVFIGAGDENTQSTAVTPLASNPNPPSSYTPAVATGKERVQAGFFLQMFDPSQGVAVERPWYQIRVSGLNNLLWNGTSIFPTGAAFPYAYNTNGISVQPLAAGVNTQSLVGPSGTIKGFCGYSYGGLIDFRQSNLLRDSITGGSPTAAGKWKLPVYPFISPPTGTTVGVNSGPDLTAGSTFAFSSAGDVTVQIYALSSSGVASSSPIQTIYLKFPSSNFPVPTSIDNNPTITKTNPSNPAATYLPATMPSGLTLATADFLSFLDSYPSTTLGSGIGRLGWPPNMVWLSRNDVVRAVVAIPGDMRLIAARQFVPDTFYQPLTSSTFTSLPATADYNGGTAAAMSHMLRIQTGTPFYGAVGGKLVVGSTSYDDYQSQYFTSGATIFDSTYEFSGTGIRPVDVDVPNQAATVTLANLGTVPGDWDNGFANSRDGSLINKPDEGDQGVANGSTYATNGNPYYELDYNTGPVGQTFFSPNRMIPSPGMFGSLPTGVWHNQPWQTLLFRPGPAGHTGLGSPAVGPPYTTPPDYLFLDLFNMPVVEPYAISTPLATAGRINMNYLIVPFTYINRDTGLRAAMKSQMITSLPAADESKYKTHENVAAGWGSNTGGTLQTPVRYSINLDSTLSQFLARFYGTSGTQGSTGTPDIFRSASEICDIDLVPNDTSAGMAAMLALPITRAKMDAYWKSNALTGDNSRERPYTNLYPLLTTKSNTYTVHFRVQTLKQAHAPSASPSAWQTWNEGTDVVTSEYRGSETIERYIDPSATLPDYATAISSGYPTPSAPLSNYYKFRVVSSRQFPP